MIIAGTPASPASLAGSSSDPGVCLIAQEKQKAAWTKCAKCSNTPRHRRRSSILTMRSARVSKAGQLGTITSTYR